MNGLGRLFDLGAGVAPVDLNTADAATGLRQSVVNASGITAVAFFGAGGAENLTLTVKQHTASTGGTTGTAPADAVGAVYVKSEATLENDELWVDITTDPLTAAIALAGATYGAVQKIVAVEIDAKKLTDGYTHVSLDLTLATSATAQLTAVLYVVHGLKVERNPASLGSLL